MSSENYDKLLKLLIIGNSGVGKSCLLMRYSDNSFTSAFYNTIGVDFKMKNIELEGKKVKVQIWDTAGQDRFKTITSTYYRGAHGILVVYDVTDRESFDSLKYWLQEIDKHAQENVIKILVGNKSDLVQKRMVSFDEAYDFAKNNKIDYIQTSALSAVNIDLVFETICKTLLHRQTPAEKKKQNKLKDHIPKKSSCC